MASYKSYQPTPFYLKKPNSLVASFQRTNSNVTSKDASPTKTSSTDTSFSPVRQPLNKAKSMSFMRQESSIQPQTKPLFESPVSNEGLHEEGDKKATIKFGKVMQLQKVTIEDKKEESRERYKTVRKYVRELKEIKIFEDEEGRVLNKKRVHEESEKVIRLAENVFIMMNIRVKELTEPLSDSAMTIFPIDERQDLATFYQMLVPEICEFPYAFLAKLKIFLITICSEVGLYNPSYNVVLAQKTQNGLFILKDMQTQEDVRDHWFKIIAAHFIKGDPEMFEEWKDFVRNQNATLYLKKFEVRSELEELILTLKCVMRPQYIEKINLPLVQNKMKFVKKQLKNFEPICFDEEWWDMKYNEDMYY